MRKGSGGRLLYRSAVVFMTLACTFALVAQDRTVSPMLRAFAGGPLTGLGGSAPQTAAASSTPAPGTAAGLAQAISSGILGDVEDQLKAGAPINALGPEEYAPLSPFQRATRLSPLQVATRSSNTPLVRLLVAHGADPNFKDEAGGTALHMVRKAEIAAILIAKGANLNVKDENGETPLHISNPPITDALLAAGADVNVTNGQGETPLVAALKLMFPDMDPKKGSNCIMDNPGVQKLFLLTAGNADLKIADSDGNTALSLGQKRQTDCKHADIAPSVSKLAKMLGLGAPGPRTATHLVRAVEDNDLARVKAELGDGAPINGGGSDWSASSSDLSADDLEGMTHRWTPLGMAAHQGNFAIVKFLIDHGADVKLPASQEDAATPLHLVRKDPEIVKLLISKGADPNDTSALGHTPLDSVVTDVNEDVGDRIRIFNALLAGGAQVDHEQSTGATPLIDLLNSNQGCFMAKILLPMVTTLVAAKANVKAEDMFHNSAQSLALEMQKDCESPEDAKAAAQLLDAINRAVRKR